VFRISSVSPATGAVPSFQFAALPGVDPLLPPRQILVAKKCYRLQLFAKDVIAQTSANIRSGINTVPRSAAIGIRVEPKTKAAAEKAAAKDHRTLASLVEKVLIEWLTANGHLPEKRASDLP